MCVVAFSFSYSVSASLSLFLPAVSSSFRSFYVCSYFSSTMTLCSVTSTSPSSSVFLILLKLRHHSASAPLHPRSPSLLHCLHLVLLILLLFLPSSLSFMLSSLFSWPISLFSSESVFSCSTCSFSLHYSLHILPAYLTSTTHSHISAAEFINTSCHNISPAHRPNSPCQLTAQEKDPHCCC